MFKDPSTATGIKWADLHHSLLLIKVNGVRVGIDTAHGVSDAVEADVHVLDGAGEGTVYENTLVFPKVLQNQLKPSVGDLVLGRLGQGQAKRGQSAPWSLSTATEADKAKGRDYYQSKLSAAPF